MKLSQLSTFVAVAERGSLRTAARALGVAQPAVTRSIQELERELGAVLFERRSTGSALTAVGERLLRRAKGIAFEVQRTRDEIAQFQGEGVGTVSIGMSNSAHLAILPKLLMPLQLRYPNVRLKVIESMFPAIEADLRDGLIDLYVGPLVGETRSSELIVDALFASQRIIVGRHGHPLAAATSIRELTGVAWVVASDAALSESTLKAVFAQEQLPPPLIAAQADYMLSIITMVASSDILSMLPHQWQQFIETTRLLQQIKVREVFSSPTIYVVRRSRLPLTPAAEYLSDLIRKICDNQALGRAE